MELEYKFKNPALRADEILGFLEEAASLRIENRGVVQMESRYFSDSCGVTERLRIGLRLRREDDLYVLNLKQKQRRDGALFARRESEYLLTEAEAGAFFRADTFSFPQFLELCSGFRKHAEGDGENEGDELWRAWETALREACERDPNLFFFLSSRCSFSRERFLLISGESEIEMALDRGILGEGQAFSEIEFELKKGAAAGLDEIVERICAHFAPEAEPLTKFERGRVAR